MSIQTAFVTNWPRLFLASLGVSFCLLWAVSVQASVTVRDDLGREITFSEPARRVISLLPSLTETVCMLGACSRLVGVDRYSNWPVLVDQLPKMGGGVDPSIEAIVAARPDVVLMAGSSPVTDRLESLGLKVVRMEPRSMSDARRVLLSVSQILGVPSSEAVRIWKNIESEWLAAGRAVPPIFLNRRVYFEVSPVPYGAGPASFIGETLNHLGLVNIIPSDMGPYPKINPEFVVRAQPDIIMLGDSNLVSLKLRPGWSALHAVQHERLCVFSQTASDVLVRAGPRLGEAAHLIAGCLKRLAQMSR